MTGFAWVLILQIISSSILPNLCDSRITSEATQRALFRALKSSQCNVKCKDVKRRPVCGTDGKTYESRCDLKRARRCERRDVDVASKGSCSHIGRMSSSSSGSHRMKCFEEQELAKKSTGQFVPDCNPDGTFARVQCHRKSGYCWCATKSGRHIPGTSVGGRIPKCRGRRRIRPNQNYKDKKRCGPQERAAFNRNLISVFKEEYSRIKDLITHTTNSPVVSKEEKRVVQWKFTELDKDKDKSLKYKEVRSLRRMIKKLIKPKACAKTFIKNCDRDRNKQITEDEWSLCLGVDISNEKPTPAAPTQDPRSASIPDVYTPRTRWRHHNRKKIGPGPGLIESKHKNSKTTSQKRRNQGQHKSCTDERGAALKRRDEYPAGENFIPHCTPSGLWEKAQCHRQTKFHVCWCADQMTGVPLPRTTTRDEEPDCDIQPERHMKGCPPNKKRVFLLDLMGQLKSQMSSRNATHTSTTKTKYSHEERVSRWKFSILDNNRNHILERKELKAMKREIKTNSSTRKCRRRFVRYCDSDGNKVVTIDEWIDCMGINHNYYYTPAVNPRGSPKNPFIDKLN